MPCRRAVLRERWALSAERARDTSAYSWLCRLCVVDERARRRHAQADALALFEFAGHARPQFAERGLHAQQRTIAAVFDDSHQRVERVLRTRRRAFHVFWTQRDAH